MKLCIYILFDWNIYFMYLFRGKRAQSRQERIQVLCSKKSLDKANIHSKFPGRNWEDNIIPLLVWSATAKNIRQETILIQSMRKHEIWPYMYFMWRLPDNIVFHWENFWETIPLLFWKLKMYKRRYQKKKSQQQPSLSKKKCRICRKFLNPEMYTAHMTQRKIISCYLSNKAK